MSQSKIFIDIGNFAVKWRTIESNVYSKSVDEFLVANPELSSKDKPINKQAITGIKVATV